ncbi:MAG TPA: hypothetical protein VM686_41815 [Polyangiaceae bacterium]|nr:hypothetical protein [Polyangiaceae bacterium]
MPPTDAAGTPVTPAEPIFPPIDQDMPDPGSREVDCSGLDGIELAAWVETFEPTPSSTVTAPTWGVAEAWSTYDDSSDGAFRAPGDAAWYSGVSGNYGEIWGMPADRVGGPSCDGQANDFVFHFRGGRFNRWGAGATHVLTTGFAAQMLCPDTDERADFCMPITDPADGVDSAGFPTTRPDGLPYTNPELHTYWDLSSYDGIVFWARRGPDGAANAGIGFHNKYTSEDLNRENATYCSRIKECYPECHNRAECVYTENSFAPADSAYRCVPEGANPNSVAHIVSLLEELYPRCGESACTFPSYFQDTDFEGTQCKPYEFSGMESNYYCYGDEPPPLAKDRCNDAFVTEIILSTDWQLYKLPFSEFRQIGFGKPALAQDLKSVPLIGFMFPVGFADIYVDNLSFYREQR